MLTSTRPSRSLIERLFSDTRSLPEFEDKATRLANTSRVAFLMLALWVYAYAFGYLVHQPHIWAKALLFGMGLSVLPVLFIAAFVLPELVRAYAKRPSR